MVGSKMVSFMYFLNFTFDLVTLVIPFTQSTPNMMSSCHLVYNVTMVIFWMTLAVNKFTKIVIDDG